MNDTGLPKIQIAAPPVNQDMVNILEGALQRVRAGKTVGLGVVEVFGPDALNMGVSGGFPSTLAAGLSHLSRLVVDGIFQKRSSLMLPQGRRN